MSERPEPFETIARLRVEGTPERDIAEAVGMDRKAMWDGIKYFNKCNPTRTVPRPLSRPETPRYVSMAQEFAAGATLRELADRYGLRYGSVRTALWEARKRGVLPAGHRPPADGLQAHRRARHKGSAPPQGCMSSLLRALTPEEFTALLVRVRREDADMASTVARLVKERLDDSRRG